MPPTPIRAEKLPNIMVFDKIRRGRGARQFAVLSELSKSDQADLVPASRFIEAGFTRRLRVEPEPSSPQAGTAELAA
jgi:hypothetical protein